MTKWLKHEDDGYILPWTKSLSKHPKLYEVTEKEAFPAKSRQAHLDKPASRRRRKKLQENLDLFADETFEEPEYSNPELNAEASKDLPG